MRPRVLFLSLVTLLGGLGSLQSAAADPISSTSTYFSVRPDLRECPSPECGGFFIQRVNRELTRCASGQPARECQVTEIDLSALGLSDAEQQALMENLSQGRGLIRGRVMATPVNRLVKRAILLATEGWIAGGDTTPAGSYYRVTDRGIMCLHEPCPAFREAKLNARNKMNIAGFDLSGSGATEERIKQGIDATATDDGVILAGTHRRVSVPSGTLFELLATQFYTRVHAQPAR